MTVDIGQGGLRHEYSLFLFLHGVVYKRMTFQGEIQIKTERQESVLTTRNCNMLKNRGFKRVWPLMKFHKG